MLPREQIWLCALAASFGSWPLVACSKHEAQSALESEAGPASSDAGKGDAMLASDAGVSDAASDQPQDMMRVSIKFAARVGADEFGCGQSYDDVGRPGLTVTPQDLRFFVQDLALLRAADGVEVPVVMDARGGWQTDGVALLDFEDGKGSCAAGGGNAATNVMVTGSVPAAEYSGVAFSNGVPEALNHADPLKLHAPLEAGSMAWGWLSGFKFLKVELVEAAQPDAGVGSDDDAGARAPGYGVLHLGSTECAVAADSRASSSISCSRPHRNRVVLPAFDPVEDQIVFDLAALFADVDLSTGALCHSGGFACPALFPPLGLSAADGTPLPTQTTYHVE